MTARCRPIPKLQPLYFVENDFGKLGREFVECDRDKNSRDEVVRLIRIGSISPVKILLVDEMAGTVSDVTEELIAEAEEAREPDTLDQSCQKLRNMLAEAERRRDLIKHGLYSW